MQPRLEAGIDGCGKACAFGLGRQGERKEVGRVETVQSLPTTETRRVLTWKEVEGEKTAKAPLVAKGFQDPGL